MPPLFWGNNEAMMGHDLAEDASQCAGAKRVVIGDCQVMFSAGLGAQTYTHW